MMFSYERHLVVALVLAVLVVIAAVVAAFFGVSVPFIGNN
jgi:Mg/Co/Ni transporter MgtE